jgi:threonine dehydrogenase-like Zn-dependent dehydrogenase
MKAVLFQEGRVAVVEKPLPPAGGDEALIRTAMAGICSTDRELLAGYHDFAGIPGHEFVGTVVRAPARPALVGRRVIADINCGCGTCAWCLTGDPRHCPERTTLGIRGRDGAFAEYLSLPLRNLHVTDESLATEEAVFAEPLAAALEVGQQLHLRSRDRVVVLGDGTLGILIALSLRPACPGLLLCGRYPEKLRVAEAQGVKTRLIQPGEAPADICRKLRYFDIDVKPLIEAVYPFSSFDAAWHHAGRRGTLKILVSF